MEFLSELRSRNEVLFYFGLICLSLSAICLLLIKVIPIQVLNVSAWLKPFKFFISTSIFVWTMGWYLHYLGDSTGIYAYSWGMVLFFTVEDLYILIQAFRGTTSHFNVGHPFTAGMWVLMAGAAVGISVWTLIVSFPFFTREFDSLPLSYLWGIRFGLILFLVFSLEGLAMGARMAHTVGGIDGSQGLPVLNWSKTKGDLRAAHFFGMHGLQLMPLLGYYLIRNPWALAIIFLLYLAFCIGVLVQALQGRPFWG